MISSAAPPRGGYFAELTAASTYRHLLYFALAALLSVVMAIALVTAVVGAALSPLLLGVPLLLLGGWTLGGLAQLDRVLGAALLGVNLSRPAAVRPKGWWPWLRCRLTEANTYKILLYSVAKLLFMALGGVWLLLTLAGGLGLVVVPFLLSTFPQLHVPVVLGTQAYTLGGASGVLLSLIGFFVVMLGISGLNLLTRAWLLISYGLLTEYGENASAVREVAALREGAATVAFAGSLEETLTSLLRLSMPATTAQSAHITVGPLQLSEGPARLPAFLGTNTDSDNANAEYGRDTLQRTGDLHVLSLALAPRGEVLGRLQAVYSTSPSTREMQFWAAVSDQAASAAHTARLIDQAQTQGSEQERARLARELHDSVAQALYGVSLSTRTARALLEKNPAKAAESLDFALSLADGASAEMKALLFALRPDALEEGGLVPALTRLAEMLRLRYQLQVELVAPTEPPLSINIKGTLYRVAQEATHNAVKHARAEQLSLSLLLSGPADDTWTLEVCDNGVGFDVTQTRAGSLGLKSMRERAALIGAILTLDSAPNQGTRLTLQVRALPVQALEARAPQVKA
ncbi:histidine kinase [Deinococcus detaillensis]|uniref:Histidine kinase n=1 Tax=Deinococcus detaillensis TaxID=2592048 RepID=A0A553UU05_9DEIO|nr:sensor histidine kinase [Deinococcus detaillensis]TSA83699.1 histidine kinase [Deinococcus detaillensis]